MDIAFNCSNCSQHIVIDEAGAEQLVDCPKCGQSLTVPSQAQQQAAPSAAAPPSKTGVIAVSPSYAGDLLHDVAQPRSTSAVVSPETKQCPFCAETVKKQAIVCKYCGRDLVGLQSGLLTGGKVKEHSTSSGGTESWVSNMGVFLLVAGLLGFAVFELAALNAFQEDVPSRPASWWVALGIVSAIQGIACYVVLGAAADVIRLLKKLNGLPFVGDISKPDEWYSCTKCKAAVSSGDKVCWSCRTVFQSEAQASNRAVESADEGR